MTSRPRPRPLLHKAIKSSSIEDLQSSLALARTSSPSTYSTFLRQALAAAVRAGSIPLSAYLLDNEHAPLSSLTPGDVSENPSIALFETLVSGGLDVNATDTADGQGKSQRLIDYVIHDDELVRWLLDHGARVDSGEEFINGGYEIEPRPAPLTESCAAMGTVQSWKSIRDAGAKIGRRVLHQAAGNAAAVGAFNSKDHTDQESKQKSRAREEMLRYLVEDEGLDVNHVDSDMERAMHWGTPISYAAQKREGAGVVRWLLERGANPKIRSADGVDAFGNAKVGGSEEIAKLLADRI